MPVRITGLASGLDIDSLVKDTLKPYMTKIDTAKQQEQILKWKQTQYQTIMEKAHTFYNKYFTTSGASSLYKASAYNQTKFTSNSSAVSVTGSADATIQNYSAASVQIATKANAVIKNEDGNITAGKVITIGEGADAKEFTLRGDSKSNIADNLKEDMQNAGLDLNVKYSDLADDAKGGLVIENSKAGNFALKVSMDSDPSKVKLTAGTDLYAMISDESGNVITLKDNKIYDASGNEVRNSNIVLDQNKVAFDGVTFEFKGTTASFNDAGGVTALNPASITGSQDVSALKDTIKSFMKDYNDLLGDINKKLWEQYDKDYQPLTDDQKQSMSDKQIENWETKAQTGLLRKDDDLRELAENMKDVMSTFMGNTGLSLEKMGYKPVKDFKEENGKYDLEDEDKLTEALQNNFDGIKELFTKNYLDDSSDNQGIIPQMRKVLKKNFEDYDSIFNKKAAKSGVYAVSNEIYKAIEDKKTEIIDLNKDYTSRQNDLYTKYSKLETAMQKLQSQESSVSSWFSSSSN